MSHMLDYWMDYLSESDYKYLIEFVDNIKNDIPNNKMILLFGNENTGKTTLIRDIEHYLGNYMCSKIYTFWDTVYEKPHVKLFNIEDFDFVDFDYSLEIIIQSPQSIISTTHKDPTLLLQRISVYDRNIRAIHMTHVFA